MYECEKRLGRNDCKNCVLYDDEMGMCLNDIKPVEPKKEKIESPFRNGYCIGCVNRVQNKCTVHSVYGKPVPCFAVEKCDKFEKSN